MVTDWQKDKSGDYTYYGEDGAKVYGWLDYTIPVSWTTSSEDYNNYVNLYGNKAWFYLDPANEGRAILAQNQSYSEVMIEGHWYAVNSRGMLWRGWCRTQRNKQDDMRRYHYYMPEAGNGFLQGERAVSCAVYTAPPADMSLGAEPRWFLFNDQGDLIRSSKADTTEIVHVGDGQYILVDNRSLTLSGLAFRSDNNGSVRDVYYFDPEDKNLRASGVKEVKLPDGRKEWYAFGADGIGITGEVDGYLYYKGRRQTGSGIRAVSVVKEEGDKRADVTVRYLVEADGKILKNASDLAGLGGTFSSNASGIATAIGGLSETAAGPAEADFSSFIGTNE